MRKGGNFMKIRKKMAGTIAMIMALSLGYNAGGPVVVHAQENAVVTEKLGETAASQEGVIDFSAIKDNEDLEVADYLPSDINDMEKICTEDYSVNLVDMADNTEDNKTVNDNPNDAKAISLGTQVYDTVATELEQRWYAFSVAKATKFTAAMVMDDTADFDLYVYKLNETDGTLELVGGSAIVGAGTQELSMLKLDEGIYFIGIEAATGNGSFLMYTYAGVNDGKEINDTTDLASSYVRNSRMTATIDSPFDYDYYKVVISKNDILEYTFDKPTGCDYKVLVYDGKNYYTINNGTYRLNTGTYYFIVMASSMNYSDDKYYGIKFQKYKLADDENAKYMWYTPDKAAIFQFDGSRTNFYVNGNPIDFTYERTVKSNGNIYFNLYKTKDQNVVLFQSEAMQVMQEVPTFINVSAPFSGWNSYKNALVVGLFNTNWRVNSFSSNYDGLTSNCATVIIDSDTGKVVDVMTPNPLYDNGVVLHWTRVSGVQANYNYDPVD